jgi:L-ascorbate metabolism protein UlaG (beta-lactamase superfamily)
MSAPVITLIGGPTALIEANGFRLLTDPTFDPPGEYKLPHVHAQKARRTGAHGGRGQAS